MRFWAASVCIAALAIATFALAKVQTLEDRLRDQRADMEAIWGFEQEDAHNIRLLVICLIFRDDPTACDDVAENS